MNNTFIKKIVLLVFLLSSYNYIFSQDTGANPGTAFYKFDSVIYNSKGKTNINILKRTVEIDTEKLFSTKQELLDYISIINQQLINLRLLDNIELTEKEISCEENIHLFELTISFSDSKHLLILPKPSYNSNTGFELKAKLKDTNFLGLLNTFNFDFNGIYFHNDVTDEKELALGVNFDYSLPFQIKHFQNSWDNDFTFKWTLGHEKPEYSYTTGFCFLYPFKKTSLKFEVHEAIARNEDYEIYNDTTYITNQEKISYIIPITRINQNKLTYTPAFEFIWNTDKDGINKDNTDLYGPIAKIYHTLSLTNYNWIKNFRDGYSFSLTNSYGFNFDDIKFIPAISLSSHYYKAFKYLSFNTSLTVFKYFNSSEKIGDKLRGTRDNQYFLNTKRYALNTSAAIVLNIDLPIHLFTTDWYSLGSKLFGAYNELSRTAQKITYIPYKLFGIADFEMQFSPFIDIALTDNFMTKKVFSLKDGFYNAGFEILIFPLKWKSYVIRTSVGFDIGNLFFREKLNTEWRETLPPYEIFFGLGLHY